MDKLKRIYQFLCENIFLIALHQISWEPLSIVEVKDFVSNENICQRYFRLRLRIFVIALNCLPSIQTYVERNKRDD